MQSVIVWNIELGDKSNIEEILVLRKGERKGFGEERGGTCMLCVECVSSASSTLM